MPTRLALVAALVATLLLPGAALAADPATDPSPPPGPPPATPALTLAGGGIVGGSEPVWFVPTATDGQAGLGIAAGPGDAGRTVGFRVDPVPAGWHLASGVVDGRSVGFSFGWDAGAPDALVAAVALDADGQASAPAYLQLVSVAAPPLVGDAALDGPAIPVGFTPTLVWRESDGRGQGIVRRVVSGEHAAPTPAGCPTAGWTLDAEAIALDALALLVDDPVAAAAGREVPGQAVTAGLPLPGLTAGCHRFRIEVVDALGQTADAVSPALLVGSLPGLPSPPTPPWSGTLDLFRPSAFVAQATSTWCVAAAALMMKNLVLGRADRSAASQKAMISWAQRYDGIAEAVGTNAVGWAAVLDRWSGADYEALYLKSFDAALRTAAARIARTGKPVGIIVGGGTHAWVLHGFVAPANPARGPTTISAVFVSGPLYARRGRSFDPAPDTRLSVSQLRRAWRALGAGYDNAGTWVVVAPTP